MVATPPPSAAVTNLTLTSGDGSRAAAGVSRSGRPRRLPGLAPAPQAAWTASAWNPLVSSASPRLLDVMLGAGLMMEAVPGWTVGIPFPEMCAILLLAVAAFRPPRRDLSRFGLVAVAAAALLVYLVVVTLMNDLDPLRRGVRIMVLMLFIVAIAEERLDVRGLLQGMAMGGLINVPLFYAGLVSRDYGSYLTGFLGDKNVAGLFYALIGPLLVSTVQRTWVKAAILAAAFGLTFLTGSRTSLAALACATLWILLTPYLGRVMRLGLLWGMAQLVTFAEENLATLSVFGDRTGTDWFREQIHAAAQAKTAAAPWYGSGLSTAVVDLEQGQFFYHNSYWALITEGGWVFLLTVVGAYVLVCLRPFTQTRRTPTRVALEAAAVVILVTSLQLGEVFITIYGALALGMGLLLAAHEAETAQTGTSSRTARIVEQARRDRLRGLA
ncbi:hypothetical protein AAG742_02915 [Micrococcus sp. 2A]|uniref:O-antigen ligase family protein n=2 Tax=Micrococcaceae TaxID=1268 RepID=UPI0031BAF828